MTAAPVLPLFFLRLDAMPSSSLLQSCRSSLRALAALATALGVAATGTLAVASLPARAQELPGFTLWGGPRRENQLNFRLDRGTEGTWDRYRLRIPAQNYAIAQIAIDYPDYYKGEFNADRVEVRYRKGGEKIEIDKVVWNRDAYVLEIFPKEPIPAGRQLEVVLHEVRNPQWGGMYYFNCRILTPGDTPLLRYIGTWILQIT